MKKFFAVVLMLGFTGAGAGDASATTPPLGARDDVRVKLEQAKFDDEFCLFIGSIAKQLRESKEAAPPQDKGYFIMEIKPDCPRRTVEITMDALSDDDFENVRRAQTEMCSKNGPLYESIYKNWFYDLVVRRNGQEKRVKPICA